MLVVTPHCGYSLRIPIEDTHLGTCPLPFLPCSEATQCKRTQLGTLFMVANPITCLLQRGIYSGPFGSDFSFPSHVLLYFYASNQIQSHSHKRQQWPAPSKEQLHHLLRLISQQNPLVPCSSICSQATSTVLYTTEKKSQGCFINFFVASGKGLKCLVTEGHWSQSLLSQRKILLNYEGQEGQWQARFWELHDLDSFVMISIVWWGSQWGFRLNTATLSSVWITSSWWYVRLMSWPKILHTYSFWLLYIIPRLKSNSSAG
jgi:hypothetical protein